MSAADTSIPEMLVLRDVRMTYVQPRRYRDYVMRPFQPPQRLEALRGVNLLVPVGERIAIFGENGAGKTTLLKLIAGLLLPSGGEVLLNGHDTAHHGPLIRRHVGYILNEERSFYWRLTGRENLEYFAALDEMFGAETRDRIGALVAKVGLNGQADRRVAEYSAGMKQRLAIARGLLTNPDLLLLDEPTRSLDPIGTAKIHELLREAIGADQTMIVATNRLEDAATLCRHMAILRHGTIAATGPVDAAKPLEGVASFVHRQLLVSERS